MLLIERGGGVGHRVGSLGRGRALQTHRLVVSRPVLLVMIADRPIQGFCKVNNERLDTTLKTACK